MQETSSQIYLLTIWISSSASLPTVKIIIPLADAQSFCLIQSGVIGTNNGGKETLLCQNETQLQEKWAFRFDLKSDNFCSRVKFSGGIIIELHPYTNEIFFKIGKNSKTWWRKVATLRLHCLRW